MTPFSCRIPASVCMNVYSGTEGAHPEGFIAYGAAVQHDMIGPARNTAVQIVDGLPIHAVPETFQIGDRDFCSRFTVKQEPRITIHMGSGIQHNIVYKIRSTGSFC